MKTSFKIFQITDAGKANYAFCGWDYAKKYFSPFDYTLVYEGSDDFDSGDVAEICEEIFIKFNNTVPGFKGHYLSVSDLIVFEKEYNTLHYVDSFGFKTIQIKYKTE